MSLAPPPSPNPRGRCPEDALEMVPFPFTVAGQGRKSSPAHVKFIDAVDQGGAKTSATVEWSSLWCSLWALVGSPGVNPRDHAACSELPLALQARRSLVRLEDRAHVCGRTKPTYERLFVIIGVSGGPLRFQSLGDVPTLVH